MRWCASSQEAETAFDQHKENMRDALPLLHHSGYLTIKAVN